MFPSQLIERFVVQVCTQMRCSMYGACNVHIKRKKEIEKEQNRVQRNRRQSKHIYVSCAFSNCSVISLDHCFCFVFFSFLRHVTEFSTLQTHWKPQPPYVTNLQSTQTVERESNDKLNEWKKKVSDKWRYEQINEILFMVKLRKIKFKYNFRVVQYQHESNCNIIIIIMINFIRLF